MFEAPGNDAEGEDGGAEDGDDDGVAEGEGEDIGADVEKDHVEGVGGAVGRGAEREAGADRGDGREETAEQDGEAEVAEAVDGVAKRDDENQTWDREDEGSGEEEPHNVMGVGGEPPQGPADNAACGWKFTGFWSREYWHDKQSVQESIQGFINLNS